MLNFVVDFGIDEDGRSFEIYFDNFEEYVKKRGGEDCVRFVGEYDSEEVKSINVESFSEYFDYDGGEVESSKFKEVVEKYSKILENNNDYVLVSYYYEYDSSWLMLKRDELLKLKEMGYKVIESEDY